MTYVQVLRVLYSSGLIFAAGFWLRYTFGVTWYRTSMGKHMWWFSLLNLEFFALITWSAFVGPKLPFEKVITIVFVLQFVVLLGWRWLLFEAEYRRGRSKSAQSN